MAALTSQAAAVGGTSPSAVAVAASDTIAEAQFGAIGVMARVINGGGSPDNVSISDPNSTALGNAGTVTPVSVTNGTTKVFLIPRAAINGATGVATIAHSFTTSVTIEIWRV